MSEPPPRTSKFFSLAWPGIVIIAVWFLTHGFSMYWGLPNIQSLAVDCVPLQPDSDAVKMMRSDTCKYPPLQYLIWNAISPPRKYTPSMSMEEGLRHCSERRLHFRVLVAGMTLATSLILFLISLRVFSLGRWSVLPSLFYLLNPASIFYSHTTNMEQPYIFWLILASLIFYSANIPSGNGEGTSPHAGLPLLRIFLNAIFAACVACAVCTKDQAYGIILPAFIAYIVYLWQKGEMRTLAWKLPVWSIAFSPTLVGIYAMAGGWFIWEFHVKWIMGNGRASFVQFPATLFGRLGCLLKSIHDLIICIDVPLIAALSIMLPVWIWDRTRSGKTPDSDAATSLDRFRMRSARLLIFGGAVFLGYHLSFIQVTRFSYTRFYLPFVPLISILAVLLLRSIAFYRRRFALCLCALLLVWLCICANAVLDCMVFNSRTNLKSVVTSNIISRPFFVAGSYFSHRFKFEDGELMQIPAIRKNAYAVFGYLSETQRSIMLNRFYLKLLVPDIVISAAANDRSEVLMKTSGYTHTTTIPATDTPPWLLFRIGSPRFAVYTKTGVDRTKDLPETDLSLVDQMLILKDVLSLPGDDKHRLEVFGGICSDFTEGEDDILLLEDRIIEDTIIAMMLNQRNASANRMYRYAVDKGVTLKFVTSDGNKAVAR